MAARACLGLIRSKHNGDIDDVDAEVYISEDEFDDEDCQHDLIDSESEAEADFHTAPAVSNCLGRTIVGGEACLV